MINKIYEDADECGALHNKDCCVNFPEDVRACDAGTKVLDCCENMRIVKAIIDEVIAKIVESLSHDIDFKNEEQRKAGVKMFIDNFINP